jgi:hypothetical protein
MEDLNRNFSKNEYPKLIHFEVYVHFLKNGEMSVSLSEVLP